MRHLILTLTLIMIASCGWHLRGVTPIPEGYRILFVNGGQVDIRNALIDQLEFNDVLVTSKAEDAPASLTITEFDTERRTLAVNSLGQVAEYEFNTRLAVLVSRGEEIIPLETQARRTLTNDVNNVVATQQEEAELRNTLRTEVITRLMRRLQRLESSQAAGNQ